MNIDESLKQNNNVRSNIVDGPNSGISTEELFNNKVFPGISKHPGLNNDPFEKPKMEGNFDPTSEQVQQQMEDEWEKNHPTPPGVPKGAEWYPVKENKPEANYTNKAEQNAKFTDKVDYPNVSNMSKRDMMLDRIQAEASKAKGTGFQLDMNKIKLPGE